MSLSRPRLTPASCLVFALLLLAGLGRPVQAQEAPRSPRQLARALDAVLDQDTFRNAFWGVMVTNLESGEVLYARNPEKGFMPASNAKLYTTATALDQLGPAFHYQTVLYADGPVEEGVLQGNLIVRGAGDPTIGGHYDGETGAYEEAIDATRLFRTWADSLRAHGITRIEGDIVGDDDVFDDQPLGYGWSWDDETYYYSAEVGGLTFNDNVVHVRIEGGEEGAPGRVTWAPFNTDYVTVVNRTRTVAPDAELDEGYHRERGTNRVILSSLVPAGQTDPEEITVDNPTRFFAHILRTALQREGIPVAGRPVDVDDLSIKPAYDAGRLRRVAVHTSPDLATIATMVNKPSQNLYAEALLRTVGVMNPTPDDPDLTPGSAEMGIAAAMATFARAGVDTSRIQLVDGSGLSRMNLVSPAMTTALLTYMWNHPNPEVRDAFYASLPVGGIDGTLRNRFGAGGPAYENVRAKTGSLSNVSSLSGYVRSAEGTPLAFVLMANHYTGSSRPVRSAQDTIVNLLARYRR